MATAILSSRNSLTHRFDHEILIHRNPNSRLSRHKTAPRRQKRSPTTTVVVSPSANTNLVMGQVKILKRGETLSEFRNKEENSIRVGRDDDTRRPVLRMMNDVDLVLASVNRLGPEPEIVQKQIGDYAGAGYSVSPPPSSVPVPCFLEKNKLLV